MQSGRIGAHNFVVVIDSGGTRMIRTKGGLARCAGPVLPATSGTNPPHQRPRRTAWACAVLIVLGSILGCGGGGGSGSGAGAGGGNPTPPPPPPPTSTGTAPGTWTASASTCINPIGAPIGLSSQSLGHIPCLAGTYYANLTFENFATTGGRIGKTCNLAIGTDGSFALSIDGVEQVRVLKSVALVAGGYELSNNFLFEYLNVGPPPSVAASIIANGNHLSVVVDPRLVRVGSNFQSPIAKVHIEGTYSSPSGAFAFICEG